MHSYDCMPISDIDVALRTICNAFTHKCNMLARLRYDQNEVYSKQGQTDRFICQNMKKEAF